MRLRAIRVADFKSFKAPGVAVENISDGLNVLAAPNEIGKSTLFEALRTVLFVKHSSRGAKMKKLQPYGTALGPTIEIDFVAGTQEFRLTKRFLSRPFAAVVDKSTGQTVVDGDGVQDWIVAQLASENPDDGPTGLLWIEQGASLEQPVAKGSAGQLISDLLQSAVSEVTGGARVKPVLQKAQQELNKLLTEGRKQPTGRYRDTIHELKDVTADVDALAARANEAEVMRSELFEAQKLLAGLQDPNVKHGLDAELAQFTERWAQSREVATRLEGLEKEIALSRSAISQDQERIKSLQDSLNETHTHAQDLQKLVGERDQCQQRLNELKAEHQRSLSEESEAVRAVTAARSTSDRARKAAKARDAQARFAAASDALSLAHTASKSLEDSQRRRDMIQLDRSTVERLAVLQKEVVVAEARLGSLVVTASVAYDGDPANKVRVGGRALQHDETIEVSGRTDFLLDGIGTLRLNAGAAQQAKDAKSALATHQAALQNALRVAGVASIEEARGALETKTKCEAQIETAKRDLNRVAPNGIEALEAHTKALQAALPTAGQVDDTVASVDEAQEVAARAEDVLTAHREKRQAVERTLTDVEKRLDQIVTRRDGLAQHVERAHARHGTEAAWQEKIDALLVKLKTSQSELQEKLDLRDQLKSAVVQNENLDAQRQQAQAAKDAHQSAITDAKQKIATLDGELRALDKVGLGEKLAEQRDLQKRLSREVDALASEARALSILIAVLEQAEADSQQNFFAPVMAELQPLLQEVMPDSDLRLQSDFAPQHITRGGVTEEFVNLSGGTREQIAILTRLAFARLMARRGRDMPVILDDALVYADDQRIARMFDALRTAARDIQLIVLTCRQKTFQELKGHHLKLQTWQGLPD